MRKMMILGMFMFSFGAYADWKEQSVILDVKDVTSPGQIAETLGFVKGFQEKLVSYDLASPSKLVLKSITARVSYYQWENDSKCHVPHPEKIEPYRVENVWGIYYFVDRPDELKNFGVANGLPSPCNTDLN